MKRENLVVGFSTHKVRHGTDELCPDDARQCPTDQVEKKTGYNILNADHFVIQAEAEVLQPSLGLEAFLWLGLKVEVLGCGNSHDQAIGWGSSWATAADGGLIGLFFSSHWA